MNFRFLIILSIFLAKFSFAQSPEVHCLSVALNGNVTVNWTPANNMSAVFVQYNIYSNHTGTFTQVGTSTNVGASVFMHNGANAHLGAVDYFVTLTYDNGSNNVELPALDTLSTIYLNVNNPGDGTAIVQWSDLSTPVHPANGMYYYINREYPAGVWNLVDSVLISASNYYRDTIEICSANFNYRISLNHSAGCQSFSNIDGDLFLDLIPPVSPELNSVTVDTVTGNAILNWNPSTSEDAAAYIILQNINGGWIIIDTVYGYNNTNYINNNSNADLIGETYAIAAFDSCWNGNPPTPNTSPVGELHKSIFQRNTYNVCEREITLRWNKYVNWSSGVGAYQILRSVEGGPYALIGSNNNTDTVFVDNDIDYQNNYCYIIRGISGNAQDSVLSNISCRFSKQAPSPNYAYIKSVTIEDEVLTLKLHPDVAGITKEIEVLKSTDGGLTFETLTIVTNITNPLIIEDEELDIHKDIAIYKYIARDSCLNVIQTSNSSNNIVLKVNAEQNKMINLLQWNTYKNWNGNILGYRVYRAINNVFETTPIAILPPSQFYYEDDASVFIGSNSSGQFCYKVEAFESINSFNLSETATSNTACDNQNPLIYIPNAMIIGGYNDTWKPVANLLDFESYLVRVYTRFGEVIFETSDQNKAWDGTYKGGDVPLGVYVYQVTFKSGDGSYQDLRGTVTVIR